MSKISKERREELRRDMENPRSLEACDYPTADEVVALLDMADERDRYRALLGELHEYFDQRADADCEGDPLRYVPNEEMRWKYHIESELNGGDS